MLRLYCGGEEISEEDGIDTYVVEMFGGGSKGKGGIHDCCVKTGAILLVKA